MAKPSHLPYRKGVGMMLLNKQGRVFVAKRIDMTSEAWQMPQGGIDEGEDPRVAALRELKEEVGTDNATILGESAGWYDYDLPEDLIPKVWGGRYRGQTQKWFVLRLNGSDDEIDIVSGGDHAEFSEWKWVDITQLPEIIVPFKRELYAALVEEFKEFAVDA